MSGSTAPLGFCASYRLILVVPIFSILLNSLRRIRASPIECENVTPCATLLYWFFSGLYGTSVLNFVLLEDVPISSPICDFFPVFIFSRTCIPSQNCNFSRTCIFFFERKNCAQIMEARKNTRLKKKYMKYKLVTMLKFKKRHKSEKKYKSEVKSQVRRKSEKNQ